MLTNPWHGQFLTPGIGARSEYHWLWWIYATFEYSLVLATIALYTLLAYREERHFGTRYRVRQAEEVTVNPAPDRAMYAAPDPPAEK